MRLLLCLCLVSGLFAGERPRPESPQPGRNEAFLSRIQGDNDGSRPWRTYKLPEDSGSAVVEVIGELTKEELRQAAFQEFIAWFRLDLYRFLNAHGATDMEPPGLASATLPVERFGGNPVPRNVPLGRAGF